MLILRVRVRMRYMGTRLQLSLGGRQAWELGWGGEGDARGERPETLRSHTMKQ